MSTSTLDDATLDGPDLDEGGWPDDDPAAKTSDPAGDEPEADDGQKPETPSRSRSRSRSRRSGGDLDRATVRRVLERHADVSSLAESDLGLVAGLLGVDADIAAVTESSLAGGKSGTSAALQDLGGIADAESDMDALLEAIELGPDRVRALNTLVAAVTGGTPVRLHASHAKAARQVVVAVRGLDTEVRARIAGLAPLLG